MILVLSIPTVCSTGDAGPEKGAKDIRFLADDRRGEGDRELARKEPLRGKVCEDDS